MFDEEPSAGNDALAAIEASDARVVVRRLMDEALNETEKRVMTLHYGHDMRLDAITAALGLTNTSGAKAYIVSARRKLNIAVETMEEQNLTSALRPGPECPSIERLGRYADGALTPEERRREESHIAACAELPGRTGSPASVCDARGSRRRGGGRAVGRGAASAPRAGDLRWRLAEGLARSSMAVGSDALRPALALAVVLLALVGGYYLTNQAAPRLPTDIGSSPEATRSLTIAVRGPIGDQTACPPDCSGSRSAAQRGTASG